MSIILRKPICLSITFQVVGYNSGSVLLKVFSLVVFTCLFFYTHKAQADCTFTTPTNTTYNYTAANISNPASIVLSGTVTCRNGSNPGRSAYLCMKTTYSGQTSSISGKVISYTVKGTVGSSGNNSNLANNTWYFGNTPGRNTYDYNLTLTAPTQAATLQAMPSGTYSGSIQLSMDMQANYNFGSCEGDNGGGWDSGSTTFSFNYIVPTWCSQLTNYTLDFGNISDVGVTSKNYDATTTIGTICNANTNYSLYLGDGQNRIPGSYRRMKNGSDFLPYQLYKNDSRTAVWDATGGVTNVGGSGGVLLPGTGGLQNSIVYGRIPKNVSMPNSVGQYTDTVVVTVTY